MRIRIFVFTLLVMPLLASSAAAQEKAVRPKGQFARAEVAAFEVAAGVEFPAHYLTTMNAEIVAQLQAKKKFKEVVSAAAANDNNNAGGGEKPVEGPGTLRISGVVTKYQGGNRAARYLVGFGAGRTKIVARIKFTDAASGLVLMEKEVDGKVVMGMFGGEAIGATRGLAKEVAKKAEKTFF